MASTAVIGKFLEAISSATIPACGVWSEDGASNYARGQLGYPAR